MEKLTKWEQVRSRQIEWKYSQVLWVRFFCPVLFGFLDDLQKEAQLESVRVTDFLRIMRITKNSNRKKEEERVTERKTLGLQSCAEDMTSESLAEQSSAHIFPF